MAGCAGMLARAAVASGPWARWPRSRGSVGVRRRSRPWARPWTGSPLAGLQSCWWRARPDRQDSLARGGLGGRAGPRHAGGRGPGRGTGADPAVRRAGRRARVPKQPAVRCSPGTWTHPWRVRSGYALGRALLSAGRARDSLCELERACQSPPLTSAERAEAQAWASFARLRLLDLDGTAAAAGEARSAAVSARDHAATSIAMASLAVVLRSSASSRGTGTMRSPRSRWEPRWQARPGTAIASC